MYLYFASLASNLQRIDNTIINWLNTHALNIVFIILAAWVAHRFGANLVARLLSHTVRADLYPSRSDRDKRIRTINSLSSATIRTGVVIVAFVMVLGEINPNYATALFASAGLLTVAISFGARDLISDFMHGLFVIYENQYRVGDTVNIAGITGTVELVTIRTTLLRDVDGNLHHIPNGAIVVTTNQTIGYSKLNEQLVLALDADVDLAKHIIDHVGEEMANDPELKGKIKKAPHFDSYNGYGQGGILVSISATTTASDKYHVRSEFYRLLNKAFQKQSIQPLAAAPAPTAITPAATKS